MPSAMLGFSARARRGFVLGTRCALCYVRLFCESKKGFCTGHEVRVVFLILFLTYAGFAKTNGILCCVPYKEDPTNSACAQQ